MRIQRSLLMVVVPVLMAAVGCQGRLAYNVPPAQQLMQPGPGVGGPGPGVIPASAEMPVSGFGGGMPGDMGVMPAGYCGPGGMIGPMGPVTSQIAFYSSGSVQIAWDVSGYGMFDSVPLVTPGRQDFPQGAVYRLRLTNIPGRPDAVLYPTLEVAPVTPRTDAYLAHSPIPIQFTEEDFDQALGGNFVTKVVYLPDPEFQELTLAGVDTLVSTRLGPGVDPIAEADRRGSILSIVRIGNKNLEASGAEGGYQPEQIFPANYEGGVDSGVRQADYTTDCYDGYGGYGGQAGAASGMPLGMPTAGFAPPAVPPHMIASMGPQYGMPMSGTPIGLPGPPHIPLGTPAGLQKHVMKNRTRVVMPPPTPKVGISVKQRPGLNYPKPVNHITIDETHREPFPSVGGPHGGVIPVMVNELANAIEFVTMPFRPGDEYCE